MKQLIYKLVAKDLPALSRGEECVHGDSEKRKTELVVDVVSGDIIHS